MQLQVKMEDQGTCLSTDVYYQEIGASGKGYYYWLMQMQIKSADYLCYPLVGPRYIDSLLEDSCESFERGRPDPGTGLAHLAYHLAQPCQ